MARESSQIKWMPAYKADDDRILGHYKRALGKHCNRKRAGQIFKQDRDHYWRDMGGSRIQYDKLTDTWRGRNVYLPSAKFGVVRDRNPNLLRNILIANIGVRYFTKEELKALFAKLFGSEKVKSKFIQANARKIIKFSDPVWHLATTPPPGALYDHKAAAEAVAVVAQSDELPAEAATATVEHPEAQLGGDYVWLVEDGSCWIGKPGTRKKLPSETVEALKMMPRLGHYPAQAEIKRIVNLKCNEEKLFKGLIDSEIITCHGTRSYTGDLQGIESWIKEDDGQ